MTPTRSSVSESGRNRSHAPEAVRATAHDRQMFGYILYYGLPYTLIATKADKLAKSKRRQAANAAAKLLGAPPYAVAYSSESGDGKQELLERIDAVVHPGAAIEEE